LKRSIISLLAGIGFLFAQTSLFQVTDQSGKKVLDVASNGLVILNPNETGDTYDDTLMIITNERIKTFISSDNGKGLARSYSVASTTTQKGSQNPLVNLTPKNTFIGHQSGLENTTGEKNVFLGYTTGKNNTQGWRNVFIGDSSGVGINQYNTLQTGSDNVFVGSSTGRSNATGFSNVFVGTECGKSNIWGSQNVFIGWRAGLSLIDGSYNTNIGYLSGALNQHGSYNTFYGYYSGHKNTGNNNTFLGSDCGNSNTSGTSNTFIGKTTGWYNSTGNYNVLVGMNAGQYNQTGSNNTLIGYGAGQGGYNTNITGNTCVGYNAGAANTVSNRLFIDNSSATRPLIYGEFDNRKVVINGNNTDNPSNYTLYVNGTSGGDYAWNSLSDLRLKKDIKAISNALDKVKNLRGVNYKWKEPISGEEGLQIGFIAQEVEKILPEVVRKGETYSMQYAPVTAVLVEAVKEQQSQIESLKAEIEELKKLIKR